MDEKCLSETIQTCRGPAVDGADANAAGGAADLQFGKQRVHYGRALGQEIVAGGTNVHPQFAPAFSQITREILNQALGLLPAGRGPPDGLSGGFWSLLGRFVFFVVVLKVLIIIFSCFHLGLLFFLHEHRQQTGFS